MMSNPNQVIVADVETGQPKLTFEGHSSPVKSVAYSKDGKTLVSAIDQEADRSVPVSIHHPVAKLRGEFA